MPDAQQLHIAHKLNPISNENKLIKLNQAGIETLRRRKMQQQHFDAAAVSGFKLSLKLKLAASFSPLKALDKRVVNIRNNPN